MGQKVHHSQSESDDPYSILAQSYLSSKFSLFLRGLGAFSENVVICDDTFTEDALSDFSYVTFFRNSSELKLLF